MKYGHKNTDLTLRHFVMSSTSVRHARVINWKSVCIVYVVFNMSKFIPNKEHLWTALVVCVHLTKTAAKSYRLLREAYDEHVHRKILANDGFSISKVLTLTQDKNEDKEHGKPSKQFEYVELQVLLMEDNSLTQCCLTHLGVRQQAVSNQL